MRKGQKQHSKYNSRFYKCKCSQIHTNLDDVVLTPCDTKDSKNLVI